MIKYGNIKQDKEENKEDIINDDSKSYKKKKKNIIKVKQRISRRKPRPSRKMMNKKIKIKKGNIIKDGIKIIQWNKGSSAILDKIN